MSNNNDIPQGATGEGNEKLSDERLMLYLEGKLSATEQHEVERWLSEEGMESDAIEGLKKLPPAETRNIANKLNRKLNAAIGHKKRKKRGLKTELITLVAIALILFLIAIAYFMIRKTM
jgi:anti-sigma factor RsiW